MQAPQHESITTMSVDVRLCGSIPRRDMKDVPSQGAPPSLKSLTSRAKLLSTASRLAEVNGCKSESTHTTISLCDGLDGLIGHKNCMKDVQQQPLVPVLEPPSWATPAKGDARLEVSQRSIDSCVYSLGFALIVDHSPCFLLINSRYVKQ